MDTAVYQWGSDQATTEAFGMGVHLPKLPSWPSHQGGASTQSL